MDDIGGDLVETDYPGMAIWGSKAFDKVKNFLINKKILDSLEHLT